jgi:hypothetical protein
MKTYLANEADPAGPLDGMQGGPKRESAADFSTGNRTEKTGSTGRYLSKASSGHRLDVMPLEHGIHEMFGKESETS